MNDDEPYGGGVAALRDHLGAELRFIGRGRTARDRLHLARMFVHLHTRIGRLSRLTRWLPQTPVREFDLVLRDGPNLRLRSDDVVVSFIFGAGEYAVDLSLLGSIGTILDLGANIGLGTIYLDGRLDPDTIVCVEPSPDNFRLLEENVRRNVPHAKLVNAAVTPRAGAFELAEVAAGNAPHAIRVVPGEGPIVGRTIADILDEHGVDRVDLMKIDIEGGEIPLFEDPEPWADRVGAILGEVHPPLTVQRAYELLAPFGFEPLPVPDRPFFADILYAAKPR